jgi:hypothetical protein
MIWTVNNQILTVQWGKEEWKIAIADMAYFLLITGNNYCLIKLIYNSK